MFIGSKTGYSRLPIAIGIWLSLEANPAKGTDDWQAPYQLGSGYALSDSGFRLGGYTNAEVTAAGEKPWQFQVTDLSLFVSWDKNSWLRFFSELELADVLTAGQHQTLSTSQTHFEYERFYFDGLVNDKLTVRVGKFLTPIGQWNVLHAAPLVWTTYRPVATDDLFSTHVSGVMLHGIFPFADRQLEYAVYGDATEAADPLSSDNPFKNALGTHLRYQWNDQLQIGVSFTNFLLQNIPSARYSLFGVDGLWQYKKYEIRSEIVYRSHGNQINERSLWQGYLQGVLPLTQHFFWVGRYEAFQQMFDKTGYAGVMGLAYRPSPPIVWKLEYRMGANNDKLAPDGLAASFAVLF
ncbi:MAG: hypothetical protein ACXV7J_03015 [Methylomonas sp.]